MPVTLGHEFAGVVAEVDAGVDGVRVGDRVAEEPYVVHGRCDACRQGRYDATTGRIALDDIVERDVRELIDDEGNVKILVPPR